MGGDTCTPLALPLAIGDACFNAVTHNDLSWVWASGDSLTGSPKDGWRVPTVEEFKKRPKVTDFMDPDKCAAHIFGGSACDFEFVRAQGSNCYCRDRGDCDGRSKFCDLMYVRDALLCVEN